MKKYYTAVGNTYPVKERLKLAEGLWIDNRWELKELPNRPIEGVTFELNVIVEVEDEVPIAVEILRREYIKEVDLFTLNEESMNFHKSNFKRWVLNHINSSRYNKEIEVEIDNVIDTNYFWMEKWTKY